MINPTPTATSADSATVAYEALRSQVLTDSQRGGRFGLILLLREGIAAWIDRRAACSAPAAASFRAVPALPVSDPLRADIVHVLASIALTRREEVSV